MTNQAAFRLLGEVGVSIDGQIVPVGPARQQCVLACLLIDANRFVPADRLIDRVWGGRELPRRPRGALQTYVSLLRRVLAPAAGVLIAGRDGGYVLTVDEDVVDLHRFRALVKRGWLDAALRLWTGEAFAGLDTPWLNAVRATLDRERHAAELDLADRHLRDGRGAALVPALAERAARHPLDERLAGQLMLALYRSGGQAEALRRYEEIRLRLADELGAGPGPELRRLHHRMLTEDPALAAAAVPRPVTPRQLPAPPRLFAGRARELTALDETLIAPGEDEARIAPGGPAPRRVLRIATVGGAGGIGKTCLALRWAHRHLARFPDGQLYANLRGHDPSGEPVPPATVLRGFLDALGADPAAVPADPDARSALYRSLLAGRRMLIVLDNARDAAQVEPLLPGDPRCAVLVTGRGRLAGLTTAHGATAVDLDVLPDADARELLTIQLGAGRVAAEPVAVSDLLAYCAGLPLALSIAAARANRHPDFPLSVLAGELRESSERLDALDGNDVATSVRTALSSSYAALAPATARVFRLLALAPGPDTGLPAAVSLTALPTDRTRAALRELDDAHLIQQYRPGRYRMHDLVRLYAAERAGHDGSAAERAGALRRVVAFALHTARAADHLLAPQRPPIPVDDPPPGCRPDPPADPAAALTWFDTEHATVLAAQQLAISRGWDAAAWQLAWALNTYHQRRGLLNDQVAAWQVGLIAADRDGAPTVRVLVHRWLGHACAQAGRDTEALDHLHRAVALAARAGDTTNQAHAHHILARAWERRGDDERALHHATRALELFRTLDNQVWQAQALNAVGWYHARLGQYGAARAYCESALALHRRHHYHDGEAGTLDSLGYIAHRDGRYAQAVEYYQQALRLYRDRGNAHDEADTLDHLADAHAAADEHDAARQTWRLALDLYRDQHRTAEAERVRRHLHRAEHTPSTIRGPRHTTG